MSKEKTVAELAREFEQKRLAARRGDSHQTGADAFGCVRWPQENMALACHPSQVAEFNEAFRSRGVSGVSFKRDGTCVLESQGAYRQAQEAFHVYNRDGGYRDRYPDNG